ncbi:MAG TPA: tetratricopeptide repeat protein [Nitrospirae bacterium]|nr:tetratricopeptide repeat protein [Nitrospirota bacterium]
MIQEKGNKENIRVCFFKNLISALLLVLFSVIMPLHANAGSEDYELYIAEGIRKINGGEFSDALGPLKKALKISPDNAETAYYAGIAYARLGNYKEAEKLFLKSLQAGENAENVYIELGYIYYVTSRYDKAEEFLSKFMDISENETLKRYALKLFDACRENEEKPYKLSIAAGGQYDSNVVLEPSNPPPGTDKNSDTRAVAYITSEATLFKRGVIKLRVDYNFYQNIHSDLDDFDVQYHKITPVLEIAAPGIVKPSVGYSLEYAFLGNEGYNRTHTYFGKITLKQGRKLSTDLIYEYRDNKYWDSNTFQNNSIRSGYKNTAGIRQNFYLSGLSGDAYYFSDFNRAKEGYWDFNGYRAGAALTCKITAPLSINVSGQYNERRYRDDYPVFQKRRLDRMQQFSVRLTYIFSRRISASITETYTVNNSNLGTFDYKRNITGIFFTAGIL